MSLSSTTRIFALIAGVRSVYQLRRTFRTGGLQLRLPLIGRPEERRIEIDLGALLHPLHRLLRHLLLHLRLELRLHLLERRRLPLACFEDVDAELRPERRADFARFEHED